MLIFGHRGAAKTHPENTVASFRSALDAGADGIECDVRATADGALVILHDATVDRTTDGHGTAGDMAAEQVASLDAGFAFDAGDGSFPFRGAGLRIPTLDEALDAIGDAHVNLELKGNPGEPGYDPSEPVARALGVALRRRDTSRIIVSSFNPVALGAFRQAAPSVRTGVLTADWLDPAVGLSLAMEAGHEGCHVHETRIDADVVEAVHAAGRYVLAWTVNDPDRARALEALGVEALVTDDPATIVAALR